MRAPPAELITYKADAFHSQTGWPISITEVLPDRMFAHTQTSSRAEVETAASEVISELTGVNPNQIQVEVTAYAYHKLVGSPVEEVLQRE